MYKLPDATAMVKRINYALRSASWMDTRTVFNPGSCCYPAKKETRDGLGMPNPHNWSPADEDWNLPENWEEIM